MCGKNGQIIPRFQNEIDALTHTKKKKRKNKKKHGDIVVD
jgi:hypothetical protein